MRLRDVFARINRTGRADTAGGAAGVPQGGPPGVRGNTRAALHNLMNRVIRLRRRDGGGGAADVVVPTGTTNVNVQQQQQQQHQHQHQQQQQQQHQHQHQQQQQGTVGSYLGIDVDELFPTPRTSAPVATVVDFPKKLKEELDEIEKKGALNITAPKPHKDVVPTPRSTVNRLSISQAMMQYGLVPLETMRKVNNAVDQNDHQTIADLADKMHAKKVNCVRSDLEASLNRAIVEKKSLEVKAALAKFPPGVPRERLFGLAVEGRDDALVEHLLRLAIKPIEQIDSNSLLRMRQLLQAANEVYARPGHVDPNHATGLEAALGEAEQMVQTIEKVLNDVENAEHYQALKDILIKGRPEEQSQILMCFIRALDLSIDNNLPLRIRLLLQAANEVYARPEHLDPNHATKKVALEEAFLDAERIEPMVRTLERIRTDEDNVDAFDEMRKTLFSGPLAPTQIMKNFVQAFGAEPTTDPVSHELSEIMDNFLIELRQRSFPPFGEANTDGLLNAMRGLLDGIRSALALPAEVRILLMSTVADWCSDSEKVPDQRLPEILEDVRATTEALQAVPVEERLRWRQVEDLAYVSYIKNTLNETADDKLRGVAIKLRQCARHCLGGRLESAYLDTIERINERAPWIGAIPKIAKCVWVGQPIREQEVKNILAFMKHNITYEVVIGTDRPFDAQWLLDRMEKPHEMLKTTDEPQEGPEIEDLLKNGEVPERELLRKIKIDHVAEWIPHDDEMIGDVTGKEIRAILALEYSGPGKKLQAFSDLAKLLGLRHANMVNGEKVKGGLYFSVDTEWHQTLPPLSSLLGININRRHTAADVNVMGCPEDTEIIEQFIVDIVHAYRQRNLDSTMAALKTGYKEVHQYILQTNEKYQPESVPPFAEGGDFHQLDDQLTAAEKRERARHVLRTVHPKQNMLDYVRYPFDHSEQQATARFRLTLALSGSSHLARFMEKTFGPHFEKIPELKQLGTLGGSITDVPTTATVFSTDGSSNWRYQRLARRVSVSGGPPLGELHWDKKVPDESN
jgi:hypothetical protein